MNLLLLELSTGLRRGEICALQWNDLNLKTGSAPSGTAGPPGTRASW